MVMHMAEKNKKEKAHFTITVSKAVYTALKKEQKLRKQKSVNKLLALSYGKE